MLYDPIVAIDVFINVQYRRRERRGHLRARAPTREGAMIIVTTSVDYARGIERHAIRVIPILLIRPRLMDVILLARDRIVLIPRRTELFQTRILIEVQYRGRRLLYLVDPRRLGIVLGGDGLAVHVG